LNSLLSWKAKDAFPQEIDFSFRKASFTRKEKITLVSFRKEMQNLENTRSAEMRPGFSPYVIFIFHTFALWKASLSAGHSTTSLKKRLHDFS
jgi:hypothetical protein